MNPILSLRHLALFALACLDGACAPTAKQPTPAADPNGGSALTSSVELSIAPVRVAKGGVLIVALFASEDSWLVEAFDQRTVPAESDTVRVTFEEIPCGRYAVAVIHDENENGELDVRSLPFPKPKEGLAVSNNKWGFGRPDWEPATFDLEADPVALDLELRY